MAKPLEFEYVIRCEDPEREFAKLLSTRPSEAARETLRRAEELYRARRERERSREDNQNLK